MAKNLSFIDESGVNLALTRLFARSPKGDRAKGKRPNKRGKNVSLIGAIGLNGVIVKMPILGSVDAITFEAFIVRKLVPKLWEGSSVVLDDCSIHLGEEIRRQIEKRVLN